MLIFKIAWRNLFRHKGKSLIVGLILFIGAFIMTMGNGVIEGARVGLEENLIERFMGHLVLVSKEEEKDNVLFTPGMKPLKVIKDYPSVKAALDKQEFVRSFIPMNRGITMLMTEGDQPSMLFVFGVNFEDYLEMFEGNVELVDGEFLKNKDRGVLIPQGVQDQYYRIANYWLLPEGVEINEDHLTDKAKENLKYLQTKSTVVLMGLADSEYDTDIELPVKGIITYKSMKQVWDQVGFMDIESYRQCFGYVTAADKVMDLSTETEFLLGSDNMESLFEEGDLYDEVEVSDESAFDISTIQEETTRDLSGVNLDNGAYNMIMVKLPRGMDLEKGKKMMQDAMDAEGVGIKVLTWKQAAAQISGMATIMQRSLFIAVLVLFFVAAVIIMNTLSMAAIERTGEIGMMRAVGARKGFIAGLFSAETAVLAAFFGGLGMLIGYITGFILKAAHISAGTNELLFLLFGGDYLNPVMRFQEFGLGVFQLLITVLIAMIYPIIVAVKITPLEAISRD